MATTTDTPDRPGTSGTSGLSGLRRSGRRLSDGSTLYWWAEILMCLLFYVVYSAGRNTNEGNPVAAYRNARAIIHLEHVLGIFHEETLEQWALHVKPLIIACNYYYGALHFVVTIAVAIVLFRKWSDDYPRWRNTLAISTGLALIGFITCPLMPPRLLPSHYGFVDTLAKYPTLWSFDSGAVNKLSNQYAAMPSVHCAWALWCACVLVPRLRHTWAKVLAACYPVLTVTAIVITANHYVLDAVAGFAVLGIGFVLARAFTRAGRGETVVAAT
jgi:PAP2 superfamily protein